MFYASCSTYLLTGPKRSRWDLLLEIFTALLDIDGFRLVMALPESRIQGLKRFENTISPVQFSIFNPERTELIAIVEGMTVRLKPKIDPLLLVRCQP